MKILVLNAGSSTYKTALYDIGEELPEMPAKPIWEGFLDFGHDQAKTFLRITANGKKIERNISATDAKAGLQAMLQEAWQGPNKVVNKPEDIQVVGHRVVHGGERYQQPVLITQEVKKAIAELAIQAPLHNPANLKGIEIAEKILPGIPQIAVFDTAFHSHMSEAVYTYPGPYLWREEGIRRYGFHGTSHQYCAERAAKMLKRDLKSLKMISCHLGNGCSLAAIKNGISVDTTMGFTPLEGLMMGTRCGSIDPSILIYLLKEKGMSPEDLDHCLNYESGLKGIQGTTGDMREILKQKQSDARAKLAYEMFILRLQKGIAEMLVSLKGLDVLIFTAGIGENSHEVRTATCEGLKFLGIVIDDVKNVQCFPDMEISNQSSKSNILVIKTQEDWQIAKFCWKMHKNDKLLVS